MCIFRIKLPDAYFKPNIYSAFTPLKMNISPHNSSIGLCQIKNAEMLVFEGEKRKMDTIFYICNL